MTDTPVTDLEALKRYIDEAEPMPTRMHKMGYNAAIDHIAELIRTGRIRLGGGE